ncbi:insulinase family protein [Escherichia coli]|nr:insulinase family protein [Escherichia coli]
MCRQMRSSLIQHGNRGTLSNGLQWQVLTTPQRPSDRVEIRLLVNTGSLAESTQQSGYSHAIPRIALTQSGGLEAALGAFIVAAGGSTLNARCRR